MTALAQRGHAVRQIWPGERVEPAVLASFDVLHIHRYSDDSVYRLALAARRAGLAVTWDNDDDFAAISRRMAEYKHHGGLSLERRLASMRRLLPLTAAVTTTNETLASRFGEFGAGTVSVIENYLPRAYIVPAGERAKVAGSHVVGWVAAVEHRIDLADGEVETALRRLLAESPAVQVRSIGVRLSIDDERYSNVSGVPLGALTRHVSAFDTAIAPLADTAFNRARSNVKLKEYSAAGVPWLASDVGPYRGLGERQGGRLVSSGGWYTELRRMVDGGRHYRKLVKRASAWAETQTIEGNIDRWEQVFERAVADTAARPLPA